MIAVFAILMTHHLGETSMYYGLILISVMIFGGCFALDDLYRRRRGSSIRISLEYALMSALAGSVVLTVINGFRLECTSFTLLMALLNVLVNFGYTFCTFRALGTINLSLYSVFSMLGGMALPFLQGILIYGESLTLGKSICVLLIGIALGLTIQRGKPGKHAIYYAGVFLLNGASGILSKVYTASLLPKASAAGYSILICLCTACASTLLLSLFYKQNAPRLTLKSTAIGALSGAGNKVANYFLVIALSHVDASVQYPMVTGGVMIVSTLLCFFGPKKPSRRELLSVLFGFAGMLALFLIPV